MTPIIEAIIEFLKDQFWGFAVGVMSSIASTFIINYFDKTKSLRKAERAIMRSINHNRLRRIHRVDDPFAVIRTEWAIALRDLGSQKETVITSALETLSHMADILQPDERNVAYEALRLRLAFNTFRNIDAKYLKVMEQLN